MRSSHTNKTSSDSGYNLRQRIGAFTAAALFASAMPLLAQAQKSNAEHKKEQPNIVEKVYIPHLRVDVYNKDGKQYNTFNDLHEISALSSPIIVKYGDSINVMDSLGKPVVINQKSLDLLVRSMEGGQMKDYLNNPNPMAHKGPRAFDAKLDTERDGLTPGLYAFFPSIEETGKIDIQKIDLTKKNHINTSVLGFLYVEDNCPPPVVQTKIVEKEVMRTMPFSMTVIPSKRIIETPKDESCKGGSLLMVNSFYTGEGNWGGDLAINARVSRDLGFGAGIFFQPNTKKLITTHLQHDQYTVGGTQIIGDTNLVTQSNNEIYGVLANALLGKPCKINLGLEAGMGWARYHLKNSLEQTVKDAKTGELLRPKYVCNWSSEDINKIIYRVGGMLVMPLSKDKFYIFAGGGIIGGLPESTVMKNNSGSIDKKIILGPKTDWYAKAGIALKL